MTDQITPEIFEHLVDLAALELDAAEGEYLRQQLNNQLKAIRELEAIPLDAGVPPAAHGVAYPPERRQPLRKDEWLPFAAAQAIIDLAPESEDHYIVVPDIPHTKLD